MKYKMIHENFNVRDLKKSLQFYEEAVGLTEKRRKNAQDGSFTLVYLANEESSFELELTWLKEHTETYDLGEGEFHLAFEVDDYEASLKKHKDMGCVCFENKAMGIYFIEDPDGYWLEILPVKK
ncbi:MAG: VOC family protein [Anaerorhabdus sp.]